MIRQPAVAGRFYDDDPESLDAFVDTALVPCPTPDLRALIVPHAGYSYSGAVAGRAFSLIEPDRFKRVILIGPSHHKAHEINGISVATFEQYAIPGATVPVDLEVANALLESPDVVSMEMAHQLEHCLEVQLPFIHRTLRNASIVPILCGRISTENLKPLATAISRFWDDDTLLVISSDFNHVGRNYGYLPFPASDTASEAPRLDLRGIDYVLDHDLKGFDAYLAATDATICGRDAIRLLLTMLPDSAELKLLEYTNSGQVSGDYSSCVGYAAIAVTDTREFYDTAEKALMMTVVKDAIAARLAGEAYRLPADVPETLMEDGACFVTLRMNGDLRGCIGTLDAHEPLLENIVSNAQNAAFGDYRFSKLTKDEYPNLEYHVSVLTPSRPVDGPNDVNLGTHGIILHHHGKRAVFLPEVPTDQGWDLTTTLEYLSRKAGLPTDAWKDADYQVFETVSFGE